MQLHADQLGGQIVPCLLLNAGMYQFVFGHYVADKPEYFVSPQLDTNNVKECKSIVQLMELQRYFALELRNLYSSLVSTVVSASSKRRRNDRSDECDDDDDQEEDDAKEETDKFNTRPQTRRQRRNAPQGKKRSKNIVSNDEGDMSSVYSATDLLTWDQFVACGFDNQNRENIMPSLLAQHMRKNCAEPTPAQKVAFAQRRTDILYK